VINEKIEKASRLVFDLLSEALSSAEVLTEIRGTLNNIQDNYILIPRKDGELIKGLLKTILEADNNIIVSDGECLSLLETLEGALLAK